MRYRKFVTTNTPLYYIMLCTVHQILSWWQFNIFLLKFLSKPTCKLLSEYKPYFLQRLYSAQKTIAHNDVEDGDILSARHGGL
jgi:hypothetical protein